MKYGEIDSASAKKPKLIEQVFTALELSINNKVKLKIKKIIDGLKCTDRAVAFLMR